MICSRITFGALLLSGALVFMTAGIAGAQNAILYEVTEVMKLKPGGGAQARVATAALMGSVNGGTLLCPDWLSRALNVPSCAISAIAHDNIYLATGQGPVKGTFAVVIQDRNTFDGPELVIAEGSLRGNIDLSPAVLGWNGTPIPLGTITGRWSARGTRGGPLDGLRTGGTLTGTFRLPFLGPQGGAAYMLNPLAYPKPDSFTAIAAGELSLGVPTVRLELSFVEGALTDDD
jgi:hypothetical protein